ncbi:MAG TPA: nuclease-related domain-containing protein [Ktedonobacterales bacterium]|jgi:hypothetical protein|nr:nuclease-related domain-containing protein [Ktedonobacterales bacterium]
MWVVDCSNYLYQRVAANEWAARQALIAEPRGPRGLWRNLWWRFTGGPRRARAQRLAQSAAAEREAEIYRRGLQGEQALIWFLASRLDNRYLLLRNYTPPPPWRSGGDIDGVLLGPQGVTVLEVKAWRGVYRCEGEDWLFLPRDRSAWEPARKNPTQQARFSFERVRGTLILAGLRDVPMQPVIVAADPRMRVEIVGQPAVAIYQPFKDPTWLDLSPRPKAYSHDELDRIYKALIARQPATR